MITVEDAYRILSERKSEKQTVKRQSTLVRRASSGGPVSLQNVDWFLLFVAVGLLGIIFITSR